MMELNIVRELTRQEHGRLIVQVNQEATEQINRTKKPGATVIIGEKGHDG